MQIISSSVKLLFLNQCLRVIFLIIFLSLSKHTSISNRRLLRSHQKCLLLESKLSRTETYKGYNSNGIVTLWNKLPPELRIILLIFLLMS